MFAKKLLRASTLVVSAVLVGTVGFSLLSAAKKVSAVSGEIVLATGVNSLTNEEEDYKLLYANGEYQFYGYSSGHYNSDRLGIPKKYTVTQTGEVVTISGIAPSACYGAPITEVAIPEGVRFISNGAFYECKGLTTVSFPSTLKTIGAEAFKNCELLKIVDLSKTDLETVLATNPDTGRPLHRVGQSDPVEGNQAFANCISLQEIRFPKYSESFNVIPEGFCKNCRRLTSISLPDSVTQIDRAAFENNILLESVRFPSGLEVIDSGAFKSCSALTSVKIPNDVFAIGDDAFNECSQLSSVTLSEGSILEGIGAQAFRATKLKSFTIPSTCEKLFIIYKNAFAECKELTTFTVKTKSLRTFDKECFLNCETLTTLSIDANSLTGIGDSCFKNCKLLSDIASKKNNILKKVVNIGPSAFYGCESFTEFLIPDVPTIGEYTFYGCKNIQTLYFSSTNENALDKIGNYAFALCAKLVISGGKIPDTVTVIGDYAFSACSRATSIIAPECLEKIGKGAFKNCTALKAFSIPDGIDEIYEETFYGCASIKSIAIPEEVTIIPAQCFYNCISLESVTMGNQITAIRKQAFYGCTALCHQNGVLSLSKKLELLGDEAFSGCKEIKSVSIPSGVTAIPDRCFAECSLLKSLNLNKVTAVGQAAFEKCVSLENLDFPTGFDTLGRNAFRVCKALEYVIIPDTITQIPDGCFGGCENLQYVKIPSSVTALGRGCFSSCNLIAVELPDSLLAISSEAFEGNRSLHRVKVNNNQVTIISYLGTYAEVDVPEKIFNMPVVKIDDETYRSKNVRSVHVPSSVKSIGNGAFQDCINLLTVRIASTTSIADNAFEGCQTVYNIKDSESVANAVEIVKFYGYSKTVNIPESLEGKKVIAIGNGAFKGNIYIQDVVVPKSVLSIGAQAFMNCSNAYVLYPAAASVGSQAFAGCKGSEAYGNAPTITAKPTVTVTPAPGKVTPVPADGTIADFVERLYTVALNRQSDPNGKAYWVREVTNGNKTGADCARGFLVDTPEFQNRGLSDDAFVETLYQTFFGRASEAGGKRYWIGRLQNKTATRLDVILNFIDSTEWCNICAGYGVKSGAPNAKSEIASKNATNFATRLYTCCLGRDPEAGGLKYWSLALTNLEQTGSSAAKQFFDSTEFKNLGTSDEEYVTRLYKTFMDRDPEASGFKYWVGLLKSGTSRYEVLKAFSQTPEFTNICKKYGIDQGTI